MGFKIASPEDFQNSQVWCTSSSGTRLGGSLSPKMVSKPMAFNSRLDFCTPAILVHVRVVPTQSTQRSSWPGARAFFFCYQGVGLGDGAAMARDIPDNKSEKEQGATGIGATGLRGIGELRTECTSQRSLRGTSGRPSQRPSQSAICLSELRVLLP